jgi:Family of unknown function (DUF6049)
MPPVRRFLGAVAAALVAVCAVAVQPPAVAQDANVSMRLLSQSPWSSKQHRAALDFQVEVTNNGTEPLRDLGLRVGFGDHISSQADFDEMLTTGVTEVASSPTKTVHGSIDPGKPRTIPMTVDLTAIGEINQIDSQVYPASITLLSQLTVVTSLVTPVIYLVQPPDKPMLSSVAVPLPAPIAFGADDALVDTAFPSSLGQGGTLRETLDAIAGSASVRHPRGVVDLIADPMVITQARDVSDGYHTTDGSQVPADSPQATQATRFLAEMTSVVSATDNVETVAEPFGNPNIPSMLATYSGFPAGVPPTLETQLDAQRASGIDVLSAVNATPSARVISPNGAQLNDETLAWLARESLDVVLASDDTVDRSPWQGFSAPAPTVPTAAGPTLVLPDPNTQALFDRTDLLADPVRASQMVLGELAFIWKQEPVPDPPTQRGVAIAPPATLPPSMWGPLLDRLAGAPFLKPVSMSKLVDQVTPDNPNDAAPLVAPSSARFDDSYAADMARLGGDVSIVNSMLGPGSEEPTDLRRRLFTASEPTYLFDPLAGGPWLTSVDGAVSQAFAAVTPNLNNAQFTLTSHEGSIPLQMGDPGDHAYHVTLELHSQDFTFPNGDQQDVVVDQPGQVVSFRVIATSSGQNPIYLQVRDPNGRLVPVNDGTTTPIAIPVRSTAVNSIALLVTVLAALGLVALYVRRWFRRRRMTAT